MNNTIKKSEVKLQKDLAEYIAHIPFLFKHREEIFASADYFYALLPFRVYGMRKSICLGALLRSYEKGWPYYVKNSDETEEFIAYFVGNPLTGTTSGLKVIVSSDGLEVRKFSGCGFLLFLRTLKDSFSRCELSYKESKYSFFDVLQKMKS